MGRLSELPSYTKMPRLKDAVPTGTSSGTFHPLLRVVGWLVLATFFATQTFVIPAGRGEMAKTLHRIVAVVVEEALWNDGTSHLGISSESSTLRDRITRYAQDVQNSAPWTRVVILLSAADEPVERIARSLEKLYFEGEEGFDGLSQLSGVVLVGDVPLPVVEQDGHLFESVYPYTDFLDKVFIHDRATGLYKPYVQAPRQQSEVWHGVIRGPERGDKRAALAAFFDKNHAYHADDPAYSSFDRKVFFADLVQEPMRIGAEGFLPYQLFLEHLEDIVYERYTARLLAKLTRRMQDGMDQLLREEGIEIDSAAALGDLSKIPDQYTKQPIEQMLRRFIELMGAYTGEVADAVTGSGRWTERDVDTFARRITLRDEAGAEAMKAANERLGTLEDPVNLFATDRGSTRTLGDAKALIDRILQERGLPSSLLTTDGLYDVAAEALVWRTYRIAEKYRFVLQEDVSLPLGGRSRSPLAGKGYEAAYFVLDASSRDRIAIPRLQDGLFVEEDEEFKAAKERILAAENRAKTELGTRFALSQSGMPAMVENATKDACGSFEEGVPLPQWFPAIMCWLRNLLPPKINFQNDGRGSRFSLKDNKPVLDPVIDGPTMERRAAPPAAFVPLPTFLKVEAPDALRVGGAEASVIVEVLDQRHEAFPYDGPLALRLTRATSSSGTVAVPRTEAQGGRAEFIVRSGDLGGALHLIASLGEDVLGVATIRTHAGEASAAEPASGDPLPLDALYVTLAGVDGGARDSIVADRILYGPGKTQAVTTLIAPERMGRTLVTVGPDGVRVAPDAQIRARVRVSPSTPISIRFEDGNLGTTVADVRYDLPRSGRVGIGTTPVPSAPVTVRDVSEDGYAFVEQGNDVAITKDGRSVGSIRADGSMDLPRSLSVEMAERPDGMGVGNELEILEGDRVVALLVLSTASLPVNVATGPHQGVVTVSVPSRLYDVARSGPYVTVSDPSERSENRHTYASLNNRSEEAWSGWRGDFINKILFAAGNSVGESVRHNASASVITLGDPTVAVDGATNQQVAGYGKDVGQAVAQVADSRIAQVATLDYNRDGSPDILVLREDATLDLYHNYNRGSSYKAMGTLIAFERPVTKILPMELDGDGWVDLLALSNDGTVAAYDNSSGAFQKTASPLAIEGNVAGMEAADFDQDGRTDTVILRADGTLQAWFAAARGFAERPVEVDRLRGEQRVSLVIEQDGDARPNILIPRPDEGKLVRYFATGDGRTFERRVSDIPAFPDQAAFTDTDGNGVPDEYDVDANGDGIPDAVEQQVRQAITSSGGANQSRSFDLGGLADDIDRRIDSISANLCPKKSGGCPAILGYNKAFLAPGYSTVVGPLGNSCIRGAPSKGKPVISLPPIEALSVFRLYVMPTLTGGVGIAACFGKRSPFPPYGAIGIPESIPLIGNCFVRSFNPLTQACKGLTVLYDQLWNGARGALRGAGGVSLFQVGIAEKERPQEFDNGVYTDRTKKFNNVRPKAFPAFIMTWVERQVEEIATKLTDLPSITLVLPEFSDTFVAKDLKGNEQKRKQEVKYVGDALDYLNSLPFLNIKVEDVNVKYPALPKSQMKLMQEYYEQWVKDAEEELKSFQARADIASCLQGDTVVTGTGAAIGECSVRFPKLDARIAAAERTIQRVKSNLTRLQEYADFPQTIEKLVNYKTEIIRQTTLYLDRIANYMGGYYLRNRLRVVKWQETYRLIKQILENWQLLPDIFTQYRNACTTCRNDRGNYMDCKMTIWKFVLAPVFNNLPIIPFPKWPDIVVDVSNINTVVDIHIPSPHFIPQAVVLPKPRPFQIPDIDYETGLADLSSDQIEAHFEKDLDLHIPKLPALPQVPDFLPKLPNLPLPQLPDIPPPPKIPKIAGALTTVLKVGKVVLKVWCLYKKGIPLIPEQNVKGVVEYQTERSNFIKADFLDVFIPEPKLPYVDQIRVDAFVNFTFNVDALRTAMSKLAQPFNRMVTNLTRTAVPLHQFIDSVPQLPDEIRMGMQEDAEEMARAEAESYAALLADSGDTMDVDAFRSYYEEQLRLARDEEPLFRPHDGPIVEPIADMPVENGRVTALKATLQGLQEQSERQLRDMEAVLLGTKPVAANAVFAGVEPAGEQVGQVTIEKGESRALSPSRFLSLLDEAVPVQSGGTGAASNAAWNGSGPSDVPSPRGAAPEVGAGSEIIHTERDLFLYDPVTRNPERLVSYAGEEDIGSVVDTADLDGNGENDIVYNLGSTIMVKRNGRSPVSWTYSNDEPPVRRIFNDDIAAPSMNYVRTTDGYRFSGLFWNYEPQDERIGYRLILRPVINGFDRERSEGAYAGKTVTAYFALPGREDALRRLAEDDPRALSSVIVLDSPTANSAPLRLEAGTYYGRFQSVSLSSQGQVGIGTANELDITVARSENANEQPVSVIAGGNYRSVPVLQGTVLDGRLSYKTGGTIVAYAWDLHPDTDTDGDGILDNDADYPTSLYAPVPVTDGYHESILTIGTFVETGEHRIVLSVTDDAGNTAKTDLTIDVFVPEVMLDEVSTEKGLLSGHTEPAVADEPITILRDRAGVVSIVRGAATLPNGQQRTDVAGKFVVEGFRMEKGIEIRGTDGKRAILIDAQARTIALSGDVALRFQAADADRPTRLDVYDRGTFLGWVSLAVPGVPLLSDRLPEIVPPALQVVDLDPDDAFGAQRVPAVAPAYAGGVMLYERTAKVLLAAMGSDGNVVLSDASVRAQLASPSGIVTIGLSTATEFARISFPWTLTRLPL